MLPTEKDHSFALLSISDKNIYLSIFLENQFPMYMTKRKLTESYSINYSLNLSNSIKLFFCCG